MLCFWLDSVWGKVWHFRKLAKADGQPLVWFAMGSSGQPPLVLAVLQELLKQHLGCFDKVKVGFLVS